MLNDIDTRLQKIRLRQLRCFVMVAQKKSFVVAADALGLTQPAVSRSIRELEQILSQELFDRTTRGAELTGHGRAFFDAAEAALLRIRRGTESVTGTEAPNETVRIGAMPTVCSHFLPKTVKAFKAEFPSNRVVVTTGTDADLLNELRRSGLDLVIGRFSSSEAMRGLVFEPLYDEPLILAVRAGHPLIGGGVTLDAFTTFPIMLPPEGTILRTEASWILARYGVHRISDLVETTSPDFQKAFITQTDCVAVIPRGVVHADLSSGLIVDLGIVLADMDRSVGLTTNPDAQTNLAVSAFLAHVRDAV